MDNVIMYKVIANILASTQSILLESTYRSTLGNPQYMMTNSDFVDCEFDNNTVARGAIDNWGAAL
jgi:hypothetical protein